jgi:hypothetical protein
VIPATLVYHKHASASEIVYSTNLEMYKGQVMMLMSGLWIQERRDFRSRGDLRPFYPPFDLNVPLYTKLKHFNTSSNMAPPSVDYSVYLVTDSTPAILGDKDLVAVVKAAVEGGR